MSTKSFEWDASVPKTQKISLGTARGARAYVDPYGWGKSLPFKVFLLDVVVFIAPNESMKQTKHRSTEDRGNASQVEPRGLK